MRWYSFKGFGGWHLTLEIKHNGEKYSYRQILGFPSQLKEEWYIKWVKKRMKEYMGEYLLKSLFPQLKKP